jgi:hypothetical protein
MGRGQVRPIFFIERVLPTIRKSSTPRARSHRFLPWLLASSLLAVSTYFILLYVTPYLAPVLPSSLAGLFALFLSLSGLFFAFVRVYPNVDLIRVGRALDLAYLTIAVVLVLGALDQIDRDRSSIAIRELDARQAQLQIAIAHRISQEEKISCNHGRQAICSFLREIRNRISAGDSKLAYSYIKNFSAELTKSDGALANDLNEMIDASLENRRRVVDVESSAIYMDAARSELLVIGSFLLVAGLALRFCKGLIDYGCFFKDVHP